MGNNYDGGISPKTNITRFQQYYNLICNIKTQLEKANPRGDCNVSKSTLDGIIEAYNTSFQNSEHLIE